MFIALRSCSSTLPHLLLSATRATIRGPLRCSLVTPHPRSCLQARLCSHRLIFGPGRLPRTPRSAGHMATRNDVNHRTPPTRRRPRTPAPACRPSCRPPRSYYAKAASRVSRRKGYSSPCSLAGRSAATRGHIAGTPAPSKQMLRPAWATLADAAAALTGTPHAIAVRQRCFGPQSRGPRGLPASPPTAAGSRRPPSAGCKAMRLPSAPSSGSGSRTRTGGSGGFRSRRRTSNAWSTMEYACSCRRPLAASFPTRSSGGCASRALCAYYWVWLTCCTRHVTTGRGAGGCRDR